MNLKKIVFIVISFLSSTLTLQSLEIDINLGELNHQLIDGSRGKDVEKVKSLIAAKANVNAKDNFCATPLILASYYGNLAIANILIEAGAQINAQDYTGDTALADAAMQNYPEIVKLLLEYGADTRVTNGKSFFDYLDKEDISKVYKEFKAQVNAKTMELLSKDTAGIVLNYLYS